MFSLKHLIAAIAAASFGIAFAQGTPPTTSTPDPATGAGQRSTENTPMGATGTPGGGAGGAAAQGSPSGSSAASSAATPDTSSSTSGTTSGGASTMGTDTGAAGSSSGTMTRGARSDRN